MKFKEMDLDSKLVTPIFRFCNDDSARLSDGWWIEMRFQIGFVRFE